MGAARPQPRTTGVIVAAVASHGKSGVSLSRTPYGRVGVMTDTPVREAVRAYAARQPGLREPSGRLVEMLTGLLDEAGINYLTVEGRT